MLPKFILIRQNYPSAPPIADVPAATVAAITGLCLPLQSFSGKKVGIAVGSRGIDRIAQVVRAVAEQVRLAGGQPEVFAAMGCHGEASAAGQREILSSLGVTEEEAGAPIACSDECCLYGHTASGFPVYGNTLPLRYGAVVLINRVKPHTDFEDSTESGLLKLLAIGIGNPQGCIQVHTLALRYGYGRVIRETAALMLEKLPVSFGLMLTENWKHQLDTVTAVLPSQFVEQETLLLARVKAQTVKLPAQRLHLLMIETIGKDVSGTGMDTKVVGRIGIIGQADPECPRIDRIVVHKLSPASHGNAIGVGLADISTRRFFDQINIQATVINAISSMSPEQGRIPCILPNDQDAIQAALNTVGLNDITAAHCIFIRDTNSLEYLAVSEALYQDLLRDDPHIEKQGQPFELRFDQQGNLLTAWRQREGQWRCEG